MEKKSKSQGKQNSDPSSILQTLGDFTIKENWDKFFSLRGAGDSFEWYADWPELRKPLLSQLPPITSDSDRIEILVPGCGSSRLSEFVYDEGFRFVTNVDFSKVAISDMLHRYVRSRPEMKWRVMDMTELQFADENFDIILDKGGLDALMEPEVGTKLGSKYLREVKRVLKTGGKFICLTLAESHVLDLLLPEFRFGWETTIHAIPNKPSNKSNFETFMVVSKKEKFGLGSANPVKSLFDTTLNSNTKQVEAMVHAIEKENSTRAQYSSNGDVLFSLRDLELGATGNIKELVPGRRCQLILGEEGTSLYHYKAVLLDAMVQSKPFTYHCAIFIVPKVRANEWLFSSEEGQWIVVESSETARLIMVFLDSRHIRASVDIVKQDLSPLVRNLAPGQPEDETPIPFLMANDGVKEKKIIRKVNSKITGQIVVQDVIYDSPVSPDEGNDEGQGSNPNPNPSQEGEVKLYRLLVFERSLGLVQSEAMLIKSDESEENINSSPTNSKKRKGQKKNDPSKLSDGSKNKLKIDHTRLASSYHSGIISGLSLISSSLEKSTQSGVKVKAIIIGLGAGLLPMFLHSCLPFLEIEAVELDPIVLDLAIKYFGLTLDHRLKVHVGDGIKYIEDSIAIESKKKGNCSSTNKLEKEIKILIVDADSSDLSSGLACPPIDFVQDSFLWSVKEFLSEGGIFVINLVCRSSSVKEIVVSRLKEVFDVLFSLQLEEDVNEILFASTNETNIDFDQFPEAVENFKSLIKIPLEDLEKGSERIQRLK